MKFDFRAASMSVIGSDADDVVKAIETGERALQARQQLTTALAESGAAGRKLAKQIGSCNMVKPCRSAACPSCLRHFRIWWGSEVAAYMETDLEDWFTVNIVPSNQSFPIGELNRFRWNALKDRLRKQIDRSRIHNSIMIGGFDYSLQKFNDGRSPKWRPHLYFLTQTGGKGIIEGALRKHYPPDEDTPRPVRVTAQKTSRNDLIATATYTYKSFFYARRPKSDPRGNSDTDHQILEPSHQAELALLLDRQGFLGRVFRRGNDLSLPLLTTR